MAGLPLPTQLFLTGIFAYLLWGIYVMVFGACIHVLRQKSKSSRQKNVVHIVSTSLLFFLATLALAFSSAQICLELGLFDPSASSETDLFNLIYKEFIFSTGIEVAQLLSTVIAEMILIYRCYVLWSNRFIIIVIPIILSIVETGLLLSDIILVSIEDFPTKPPNPDQTPIKILTAFISVCTTANLSLSLLIGGRIMYLSHTSRSVFGDGIDKRYRRIVAIVLESGILYSAFLIIYLAIILSETGLRAGAQVLQPSVIQITGLAPTLIVVRSGLRVNVSNGIQSSSTLLSSRRMGTRSQTGGSGDGVAVNEQPQTFELKKLDYDQGVSEVQYPKGDPAQV
ncbi:hypothetical protein D9758_015543 [Tetrapyrgos nigripes]|uniref:Uncharacterized protein n=1 Tax=Tetrapyrgos nigripes TaxID=182062 RepID=A0A8H5FF42_9AGAR|nr:hypothetical protein D9758_015543 [Tetrapyrgos nigripes]